MGSGPIGSAAIVMLGQTISDQRLCGVRRCLVAEHLDLLDLVRGPKTIEDVEEGDSGFEAGRLRDERIGMQQAVGRCRVEVKVDHYADG